MGYAHIARNRKVQAIAYFLLGKKKSEAARMTGVDKGNLTLWARDEKLLSDARKLIDLARHQAKRDKLISQGYVLRGNRLYSPESYERMKENGRKRGAQIKEAGPEYMREIQAKRWKTSVPRRKLPKVFEEKGIKLPKDAKYRDGYIITASRRYTIENYVKLVERNRANNWKMTPEQRRERSALGTLARQIKKLDQEEINATDHT